MNGVEAVLAALYCGERTLEQGLLNAAQRHLADQEIHHVATDIAGWSHEHAERIAQTARSCCLHLPGPHDDAASRRPLSVREGPDEPAQAPDEPAEAGWHLLHDLCELHLAATENSLHWEMLAQAAQATRNARLLDLATACHPQTLRQIRWTNTMVKTLSPQLLSQAANCDGPSG
jgi:hypothetical protein